MAEWGTDGLTVQPTDWLTDQQMDRCKDWRLDWLIDRMTDWLTASMTDWPNDWVTDSMTDWPNDWLTQWLTDCMTDGRKGKRRDWLTDWLTDSMTDSLMRIKACSTALYPTRLASIALLLHWPSSSCQTSHSSKKISGQQSSLSKKNRRQHLTGCVSIIIQGLTQLILHPPCSCSSDIHWTFTQQRPLSEICCLEHFFDLYISYASNNDAWSDIIQWYRKLAAAGTVAPLKGWCLEVWN